MIKNKEETSNPGHHTSVGMHAHTLLKSSYLNYYIMLPSVLGTHKPGKYILETANYTLNYKSHDIFSPHHTSVVTYV